MCLRGFVVLLLSLVLAASAQAQSLTIDRRFNVGFTIGAGDFYTSTNTWNNNGFTNISAVSVYIQLSSVSPGPPNFDEFSAAGTEATLLYNLTNSATVYEFDELPVDDTSVNQTFALTNSFASPGTNNDWDLTIDALNAGGDVVFDLWRLIVTGGAKTNGTIEAGAGGIISGTDGYTVTAVIDAGSGTGTNAVTAFVTNGQSLNFDGGITGSGELAKTGAGTLSLAGNSTGFSGTVNLTAGTANITTTTALGTGTLFQTNGTSTAIFSAGGNYTNNMTLANVSFTNGGNTLSGTITNSGSGTFLTAASTTNTISGVMTGSGGLTKDGAGELIIAGTTNNTFTGATVVDEGRLVLSNSGGNAIHSSTNITVNSGGTLVLGASNQIGDGVGLILNGGTLLIGDDTVSDTIGSLTLTGSANSVIDFGDYGSTGTRSLTFGSFSAIEWTGSLIITNWQGTAWTPDNTHLYFTNTAGFTPSQLANQIVFADIVTGAGFIEGGELVPVPEPKIYVAALAICAAIGWRERKRLAGLWGTLGGRAQGTGDRGRG